MRIAFTLNGKPMTLEADPKRSLLSLLREELGLTGTKCGCDTGDCGVCAVLFDGRLVYSCRVNAAGLAGHQVVTIEGVHGPDGGLSDVQEAFLQHGAVQCGYCIPAMVLAGEALLSHNPAPSQADIVEAITPVLCRCTGYQQIVDAIKDAAHHRQIVSHAD
ncbi:MAG TPA: (2Fe-2S)-binding protein [Anaerolineaceae bacterium]|jgi:aerobic-type carbon monoxide dehydrogenase small subunit (CoxS/CutS family)